MLCCIVCISVTLWLLHVQSEGMCTDSLWNAKALVVWLMSSGLMA